MAMLYECTEIGTGIDGDLRGNGAFHPRCRTVDPDGDSSEL